VDHGPIVVQAAVPVRSDDTAQSLAARVLQQEHQIYPQALRWFAEDRLDITHDQVNVRDVEALDTALRSPWESS